MPSISLDDLLRHIINSHIPAHSAAPPTNMAKIGTTSFIFFSIVLLGQLTYVAAECCPSPRNCARVGGIQLQNQTYACSSTKFRSSFISCCSDGPCNIFCCNCDDACIDFDACPPAFGVFARSRPGSAWNPGKISTPAAEETCVTSGASAHACTRHKFDTLDSTVDKNGEVSFREFITGWAVINPFFDESAWEDPDTYIEAVKHFKRFDANGDGILSFEEALEKRFTY